MTNTEIIQAIRTEVRRMANKYNYVEFFEADLLDFLDTLEKSEKPMQDGLEAEMDKFFETMPVLEHENIFEETFKNIARHFYELGCTRTAEKYDEIEYNRQRAEESVPKDLEEAAMNYIAPIENEDGLKVINFSGQDIKDAFLAGAEWQADHIPLPEDTVLFNKGVEEGRRLAEEEQADLFTIVALDAAQRAQEQMMKDYIPKETAKKIARGSLGVQDFIRKIDRYMEDKQ